MDRHWHRFGFNFPPFGFWFGDGARGGKERVRRDEEGCLADWYYEDFGN